jgi:hypothetical protein
MMVDLDLIPFYVRLRQLRPTSPVMVRWIVADTLEVLPECHVGLIVDSLVTFTSWN